MIKRLLSGRFAGDGPLFNPPETLISGPRLPAFKARAVEDRVKARFIFIRRWQ